VVTLPLDEEEKQERRKRGRATRAFHSTIIRPHVRGRIGKLM
jgi:hypothetical protein